MPVTFDAGGAAVPRAVARALLRAVLVARLPHARRGVRADGRDRRRATTRSSRRSTTSTRWPTRLARPAAIGIARDRRRTRPAVRADIVGWAFCDAARHRRATSRWRTPASTDTPNLPAREVFARLGPVLADAGDREGRPRSEVRRRSRCARQGVALGGADSRHDGRELPARRDAVEPRDRGPRARARQLPGADRGGRARARASRRVTLDAVPARVARRRSPASAPTCRSALAPGLVERPASAKDSTAVYRDLEQPLIPVLADIERAGVQGRHARRSRRSAARCRRELDELSAAIFAHAGGEFNINSPKQLADVLFDEAEPAAGEEDRQDARRLDRAGRARGTRAHARTAGASS